MPYVWLVMASASAALGWWAAWRATRGRDAAIAASGGASMILALGLVDVSRGLGFNWQGFLLEGTALAFTLGSAARAMARRRSERNWAGPEAVLGGAAFIAYAFGRSRPLGVVFLGAGMLLVAAELLVSARVRR